MIKLTSVFLIILFVVAQSSYALIEQDKYEFCDDNLLRSERLKLAQQRICIDAGLGKQLLIRQVQV